MEKGVEARILLQGFKGVSPLGGGEHEGAYRNGCTGSSGKAKTGAFVEQVHEHLAAWFLRIGFIFWAWETISL